MKQDLPTGGHGVSKKEMLNARNPKRAARIADLKASSPSRLARKTAKILRDVRSGKK